MWNRSANSEDQVHLSYLNLYLILSISIDKDKIR